MYSSNTRQKGEISKIKGLRDTSGRASWIFAASEQGLKVPTSRYDLHDFATHSKKAITQYFPFGANGKIKNTLETNFVWFR